MLPWRRCLVVCLFVFAQFIDFGTEWQHCIPTHRVLCQNIRQADRTTCSGCLLLIKKKKKKTQKHCNNSGAVRDNQSERPCSKTRREGCRLQRNQLVHLRSCLTFKNHRFLHRHCTGLHYYYYFVQVMQLLCPPPTTRRSSRPSLLLAGLPPHSHSRLSLFFFFFCCAPLNASLFRRRFAATAGTLAHL